ncbi:MAG: MG2 domain-containing protein, partial [Alcaligenaceae bacterium]|nr:MG2 domain-containing protein [Alcaligenaceae bacterium]
MKLKHLLFSTLLCCNVAFAQTWNDETVKNLGDQARQSIEQLIQEDSNSEIPKILGTDIAQELFMLVKKERYSIERINEIIIYILKSNEKATPYIVLRNQLSPSKMHTLVMYENLLRYHEDDDLYPYAFQKINALDLKNNNELQEQRQQIQREFGFVFYDTSVDTRQDQPEVCARFSQNIRPEPAQDWKKLMTVNPTPKSDLRYKNNQICFNTQWGTQHNITFDKKLQSDKKISLGEEIKTTVNIGHKEPMVRFEQGGNVLAQNEQKQLALTTANVSDVKVKLWQIPANNLSNSTIQSLIRSPNHLSEWSMNQLLDEEASLIFSGEFTVKKHPQDENVTTNIPFDALMKGQQKKAGFYILNAKDSASTEEDEWSYNSSTSSDMIFSISKAGLSAYYTPQGLWVELRNLEDTTPIASQDVTLYAKNNEILSTVKTNEQGLAFFDKASLNGKHGATPSHVITLSEDFFSYINIHQSSYDLSDKGLSGRIENAPLQSWLWTDRGVYRPNDTLHLMWLLKKEQNKLFHDVPIWLEFSRPDGKVMLDKLIKADENGSYRFDYYFDNTAPQGQWSVQLYLGKNGHLLAQKTIPVTSLIPRQTEASILPIQGSLSKGKQTSVTVQADWLYGAVAEKLPAYLTTSIHDTRSLGNSWNGWQIGMHEEDIYYNTSTSEVTPTNTKGQAVFNVTVKAPQLNTKPLLVKFNAHVTEPSGQITSAKYTKPLLRKNPYVAIKNVDDKHVQVALVNDKGAMQSGNATWSLYRINYDGYWYKQGSQWNYQHNETPELVTSGDITLNNTTPTALTLPIPADSYDDWVLKVHGDQAETAGSVRLNFGYSVASNKGMPPDAIRISSNQQRYANQENVKIHLKAPFSGKASVKFVHKDNIIKNQMVTFVRGEAELSFPWSTAWDDGLWILANAWNKNQHSNRNRRAIGLHWIGGDLTPYDLKLQAKLPETIRPNTELTIPLSVDNSQLKGKTWVRVAIVDDGLYQLGQSSFSNPLDTFFGKKQLNLSFFDIWGNIIKQLNAPQAILRSGADGLMSLEARSDRVALPLLDLQLVAQWTEPVMFDAQGQASVTINVPEYNGRLRVMAVAW